MIKRMPRRPYPLTWGIIVTVAVTACASFALDFVDGSTAAAQGVTGGAGALGAPPASPGARALDPAPVAPAAAVVVPIIPAPVAPAATAPVMVPHPPGSAPPAAQAYPSDGAEEDTRVRIPSRIATRLRVLDADFAAVASRGGGMVNGILSIVTGALSITLGFLVDDDYLSPYLFVFGGAGLARGAVDLLLTPNTREPYVAFTHMPMSTTEQVYAKLAYGEQELESIARAFRITRIIDASLNIGVGLAIIPIYLGPNDFEIDAFGAFVIIGAGISVISGLISLFSRTEAERRWSGYEELLERLDESQETSRVQLRYGAMPLPGGGAFSLGGTF